MRRFAFENRLRSEYAVEDSREPRVTWGQSMRERGHQWKTTGSPLIHPSPHSWFFNRGLLSICCMQSLSAQQHHKETPFLCSGSPRSRGWSANKLVTSTVQGLRAIISEHSHCFVNTGWLGDEVGKDGRGRLKLPSRSWKKRHMRHLPQFSAEDKLEEAYFREQEWRQERAGRVGDLQVIPKTLAQASYEEEGREREVCWPVLKHLCTERV